MPNVKPTSPLRYMPAALVALTVVAVTTSASAFSVRIAASGDPTRWAVPLIGYYLQMAGSDNLTPEESQLGVRRGFQSWRDVTCSNVDFEELGDVPDPSTTLLTKQVANGLNEVVWIEDDSWTLGAYTLGVTLPLHDGATGHIYEADIAFNGYLVKWKLDSGNGTDLESVAVHEIGHMFGAQHNLGPYDFSQPPTMAPNIASYERSRSLESDDQSIACFLYPAAPPYLCDSDADCPRVVGRDLEGNEFYTGAFPCTEDLVNPGTKTCEAFAAAITGTVNLGEACAFPEACADGYTCTPWPAAGEDVCAAPCSVGGDDACLPGFDCVPFAIQPSTGACLPSDGVPYPPGQGPLGCVGSGSCPTGNQCIATPVDDDGELRICVSTCTSDGELVCPQDTVCYFFSEGDAVGACFEPGQIAGPEPEPEPVPDLQAEAAESGPEVDVEAAPEDQELVAETAGPDAVEVVEPQVGTPDDGCAGSDGPSGSGMALWWVLFGLILLAVRRHALPSD